MPPPSASVRGLTHETRVTVWEHGRCVVTIVERSANSVPRITPLARARDRRTTTLQNTTEGTNSISFRRRSSEILEIRGVLKRAGSARQNGKSGSSGEFA